MLKSGSVPVSDRIHSLPNAANGTRKSPATLLLGESPRGSIILFANEPDAAVVSSKPQKQQEEDDEEEELRKLQAEMAM
jgi:hypothetical protein